MKLTALVEGIEQDSVIRESTARDERIITRLFALTRKYSGVLIDVRHGFRRLTSVQCVRWKPAGEA